MSSLGAWRNPSDSPNYLAINQHTSIAFTEELYDHSLAYTLTSSGEGVASGTLVRLGHHLLVATTRHTLPDGLLARGRDDGAVGMVGKNIRTTGARSRWLVRHVTDSELDLGAIEVTPSAVSDLGITPITAERIIDAGRGDPRLKVRAFGFPWNFRKDDFPERGTRGFRAFSYGTETLDVTAWGSLYVADLDPEVNVVLIYEKDDNIDWIANDIIISTPAPHSDGMSGGGFWQAASTLEGSELWTIDRLRLFAVQTGWYDKQSCLRGIQIIYWLKFVAAQYPDLRAELEAQFPRLRQL